MTGRDPLVLIQEALTDEETRQFLEEATRRWPGTEGAHVADVLDLTTDHDMFLDQTEPFFEAHVVPGPAPHTAALHLLIILGRELTMENLTEVLTRAGLIPAPGDQVRIFGEPEGEVWSHLHPIEPGQPGALIQHGTVTGRFPRTQADTDADEFREEILRARREEGT